MTRCFAAIFVVLCTEACTGETTPPAETLSEGFSTVGPTVETTVHPQCAPGATRECKRFFYSPSEPNLLHCEVLEQVCRQDGFGWLACGDTEPDQSDAGADAQ